MVAVKKIQLRLFDGRRNQNFWFHFCYIPRELWIQCKDTLGIANLDSQVKLWINQDFGLDIVHMDDMYKVKQCIKDMYSKRYPEVFLDSDSDRQGWVRVWLTEKIKAMLEENNG
jgi:hypothetical protein